MRRREFLHGTAAGLTSLAAGGYHRSYGQESKPKRVALIGCGWYGKCDLLRLLQVEPVDVVALCDVDLTGRALETVKKYPKAKRYEDFREMLDMEKSIDAVTISSPDHVHAKQALAAKHEGIQLYVQKTLTHNIK